MRNKNDDKNDEERLLTPKQVIDIFNISRTTLRRLQDNPNSGLKFIRIGKSIRYRLSDIKKYMEEKTQ